MVLWFITACYMVTPDGGQQGEDMDDTGLAGTDDTSLALDTGDSLLDSDGVDTRLGGIRLSVDDDRDGLEDRNCSGEIVLNEEGSGTAECVFESEGDPEVWDLVLVGSWEGDTLRGIIEAPATKPIGTYEATNVGEALIGTLQGEDTASGGPPFTGLFWAMEQ